MSTKEEIKEKARRVRQNGQLVLQWPAVVQAAEYLVRTLLSFILAGAEIFGGFAPFALGMTAASGAGMEGTSALIGACAGYLMFRGFVDGLPYVAACILTFSVSFAFYDIRLYRQGWFLPAVAALLHGVTGFVYLSDKLTSVEQYVFFLTELLLVASSSYFYRVALSPWERRREDQELTRRQMVSLFLLGCTVLISLAGIRLLGAMSLGCVIAAVATMTGAWKGGATMGAVVGISTGMAVDLSLGLGGQYAMAFAFSGLLAGVFQKQGKLFAVMTYVLANAVTVLWRWEHGPELSVLYEVFAASVLFMVLPDSLVRRVWNIFCREHSSAMGLDGVVREYGREQLKETANAFRELYDGLRTSFRRVVPNDNDGSAVFHRAANKVCVNCALRDHCWQREYPSTMNALNDGLPDMLKRGRGLADDFPLHFRTKCLNFPLLLATANEELTALRYRRQFQSRARGSRESVCRQYGLFTGVLEQTAHLLEEEPVRDPNREKRLQQRLSALGIDGKGSVWYDRKGHLLVQVSGLEMEPWSQEESEYLARLLGVKLGPPEVKKECDMTHIRWRQAEPFMAVAGVSGRTKEGQAVSGDAGAWFKTEDGCLFVLLCDGMGSGEAAHRESTLAIRLLEKFLRAGMEPEDALETIDRALALRCEEEGGFTTIDLFSLDLYNGEAGFYKLGAAPSYVRRKGVVSCVSGTSLPAGLTTQDNGADVTKIRLEPGDSIVLVSDGVAAAGEDSWVRQALAEYEGNDPKALASALIVGGEQREGATDDCTAVVLTVKER